MELSAEPACTNTGLNVHVLQKLTYVQLEICCTFLFQAVADLGWSQPTLIQEKAIPLALEGKDLLARARTGSGKTAAYAIPVIQRILASKQVRKRLGQITWHVVLCVICPKVLSIEFRYFWSKCSVIQAFMSPRCSLSFSSSWPLLLSLVSSDCVWAECQGSDPGANQGAGPAGPDHDQTVNGVLLKGRQSGRHLWKSRSVSTEVS